MSVERVPVPNVIKRDILLMYVVVSVDRANMKMALHLIQKNKGTLSFSSRSNQRNNPKSQHCNPTFNKKRFQSTSRCKQLS